MPQETSSSLAHQLKVEVHVLLFEHGEDALHLVGDATLRVVQALDEHVSVLRHQVGETEEGVGLCMFCSFEEEKNRQKPQNTSKLAHF